MSGRHGQKIGYDAADMTPPKKFAAIATLAAAAVIAVSVVVLAGWESDQPDAEPAAASQPSWTETFTPEQATEPVVTEEPTVLSEDGYVAHLDQYSALTELTREERLAIGYWVCEDLAEWDFATVAEALSIGSPSIGSLVEASAIVAGADDYLCP